MKNILIDKWKQNKALRDMAVIILITVMIVFILSTTDTFLGSRGYLTLISENYIEEAFIILSSISIALLIFSIRRWFDLRVEIMRTKDFERKMYKSRAELQAVLDGVPDMIMQVDTGMRILWANKSVLQRAPQAIGKKCSDAFSVIGESVIETYSKWAMVTGIIEKGIKYQPTMLDDDTGAPDSGSYWEGIGIPLKGNDGSIYGAIAIARDVTERMRLEHTSNLLASIVESSDDAIYGMTFDSTVLSWNLGAENIYGYYPGEIIGNKGESTVPPEERTEFLKHIEKVIRSQEIERYESVRIKKDKHDGSNREIYVSITLCPFVDATGRKIGVSAIDRDITQRKKAEEALIESEARYRELFANLNSGVAVYEAIRGGDDFIFKDFNRGGERIENLPKEMFIGRKCSDVFKEMNVPGLLDLIKKVYLTGKSEQGFFTVKEGENIISWRDNRVYRLPSGEIIAIYDDITERINAEEALRKSEEKFRTLVSTAPDGIVLTDVVGNVVEVNLAFADIFGFSREQILSRNFADFFTDKKIKQRAMQILTKEPGNQYTQQRELRATAADGKEINIELSVAHLKDEKARLTGMIGITRDISLRKQYEIERENSREQMRSLAIHLQSAREEERKNIAFEIHDELGYALTALKLDLAWMVKKMNLKDITMLSKSKSMADLIDTTVNKVRSISTQLRPSILDHFGLIAAIEWQANEFQKRTAIRCKVDIEPKDMQFKDPFSTAIFRIFQETLTNIARHSKASRVDVSFHKNDDILELIISDNGIGMPKEQLTNHKSIGLIGIRERANTIGGKVEFISENGTGSSLPAGTTVLLTVPFPEIIKED